MHQSPRNPRPKLPLIIEKELSGTPKNGFCETKKRIRGRMAGYHQTPETGVHTE
jgi:hypothetical protein